MNLQTRVRVPIASRSYTSLTQQSCDTIARYVQEGVIPISYMLTLYSVGFVKINFAINFANSKTE
jgi:hypothetical protein